MLISELQVEQKNIDEKDKKNERQEMKFKINSWKSNANGLQQTDTPPQMGHL